jgi:hypothetical protein
MRVKSNAARAEIDTDFNGHLQKVVALVRVHPAELRLAINPINPPAKTSQAELIRK